MFNFTMKQPAATTVASTTSKSTFNPFAVSQPQNASQPFIFGAGVQNAPTIGPFGNPLSNSIGTSIFGTNQPTPVAQPTNTFASNLTGTTIKFNPVSSQAPFSTASTMTNAFGSNNIATTAASPFGTTMFNTSGGPFPTASVPSANPLTTGANIFGLPTSTVANTFNTTIPTAPVTTSGFSWTTPATNPFTTGANIFGLPASTAANPLNTTTSTAPMTTSGFNWTTPATNPYTTGANIFGLPTSTAANPLNTTIPTAPVTTSGFSWTTPATNTSTQFKVGPQPNAGTNLFPQPTTATPSNNTVPFSMINPLNPPTTAPFSFVSPATSLSNTNASTLNPPIWTGLTAVGTQPTVTSSSSTLLSQTPKQEQTTSIIQQNFLAASLLDPYANRGKKDFPNINQIQAPVESIVVSTVSTSTTTTAITTSTPIVVTLPIQSNLRKVAPSRSLVDVNFKLRPVSSSPALNEDIKPSKQQSTEPAKSGLAGNFTDEEELVLLGRTKMSKLRLSNDVIDAPSQFNSIRSLYPIRRLAELEKLTNITPRSSTPPITRTTTTVEHERTSHSASNSRDASPNPRFTPSVNPKQSSSPIIQRKSSNQNYRLPILTRDNYYMKPTVSELKSLFNDKGQCILKQFTVGHEKYGSVTFYGQINVSGLNLDEIIEINRHEVTVYPDDDHKPPVGKELNLPARITLFDVYPIDRTTREKITDIERIKAANYNDYLRKITKKFDGEFINYDMIDGSWTFTVKHFTRYGLNDDQDYCDSQS